MSATADRIEAARRRYVASMGTLEQGLRYDELREAVAEAHRERANQTLAKIGAQR